MSTTPPDVPAFAIFAGFIDNGAVERFAKAVAAGINNGINHAHVLLQSGGGLVGDGVCLYNFFRTLPIDLTMYNSGTIGSAAAIAFLGAKQRHFSAHATFMVHRSQAPAQPATSVELKHLAHSTALDDARLEAILRESCSLSEEQLAIFQAHNLWLSAEEAVAAGVATRIAEFSPPKGHAIAVI